MDPMEELRAQIKDAMAKMKSEGASDADIQSWAKQTFDDMAEGVTRIRQEFSPQQQAEPAFGDQTMESVQRKAPFNMGQNKWGDGRPTYGDGSQMPPEEVERFRANGLNAMEARHQPDYTDPLPKGSMRGKQYPTEEEFGGGDFFYSNVHRWEEDNQMPRNFDYQSPQYNNFVANKNAAVQPQYENYAINPAWLQQRYQGASPQELEQAIARTDWWRNEVGGGTTDAFGEARTTNLMLRAMREGRPVPSMEQMWQPGWERDPEMKRAQSGNGAPRLSDLLGSTN